MIITTALEAMVAPEDIVYFAVFIFVGALLSLNPIQGGVLDIPIQGGGVQFCTQPKKCTKMPQWG